jgi:negative regulator of flagellin synthesis FlgM
MSPSDIKGIAPITAPSSASQALKDQSAGTAAQSASSSGAAKALPQENSAAIQSGARAAPARAEGVTVEVSTTAELAQPPVDAERVSAIKEALQDGTYPLKPTQIADALIASRFMLSAGE